MLKREHFAKGGSAINTLKYIVVSYILLIHGVCALAVQDECVDPTLERVAGFGVFFHNSIGLSVRFWTSEASGLEVSFPASTAGGSPWAFGRVLYRLMDTCFVDGYMGMGLAIPLGTDLNWQSFKFRQGWNGIYLS